MEIRDMRVGMFVRLTKDIKIGIITLEKDTVFTIEEIDKTHFTVINKFVGWGILENENSVNFIRSNVIEYESDLAKRYNEFI